MRRTQWQIILCADRSVHVEMRSGIVWYYLYNTIPFVERDDVSLMMCDSSLLASIDTIAR